MAEDPTDPCLSFDLGDFNVVDDALAGERGEKGDPGVGALAKATKEATGKIARHLNVTLRNYIEQRTLSNPAYFTSPELAQAEENLFLMLDDPVHDQVQELLAFHGLLEPENAVERDEVPAGVIAARRAGEQQGAWVDAPDHLWAVPPKFVNEMVTNWAGRVTDVRFAEVPMGVYFCLVADAGAHTNQYYNVVEQVWNGAAWVAKPDGISVEAENVAERAVGTHLLPDGELVIVERSKTQAGTWVYGFCRRVIAWTGFTAAQYALILTGGALPPIVVLRYDAANVLQGEQRFLYRFANPPVDSGNLIGMRLLPGIAADLYWVGGQAPPPNGAGGSMVLHGITSDFDPATVTWATQPTVTAPLDDVICAGTISSGDLDNPAVLGGEVYGLAGSPFSTVEPAGYLPAGTPLYGVEVRPGWWSDTGYDRWVLCALDVAGMEVMFRN